jgi:hypothetical protein
VELSPTSVMAGLVPAIHDFDKKVIFKSWMPGIKPGMIKVDANMLRLENILP